MFLIVAAQFFSTFAAKFNLNEGFTENTFSCKYFKTSQNCILLHLDYRWGAETTLNA